MIYQLPQQQREFNELTRITLEKAMRGEDLETHESVAAFFESIDADEQSIDVDELRIATLSNNQRNGGKVTQ